MAAEVGADFLAAAVVDDVRIDRRIRSQSAGMLVARHAPQRHRPGFAAAGEDAAARAEGDCADGAGAAMPGVQQLAGVDIPLAHGAVFAAAGEGAAVWAEDDGIDGAAAPGQDAQGLPRGDVPKTNRAVFTAAGDDGAIRGERNRCDTPAVAPST